MAFAYLGSLADLGGGAAVQANLARAAAPVLAVKLDTHAGFLGHLSDRLTLLRDDHLVALLREGDLHGARRKGRTLLLAAGELILPPRKISICIVTRYNMLVSNADVRMSSWNACVPRALMPAVLVPLSFLAPPPNRLPNCIAGPTVREIDAVAGETGTTKHCAAAMAESNARTRMVDCLRGKDESRDALSDLARHGALGNDWLDWLDTTRDPPGI